MTDHCTDAHLASRPLARAVASAIGKPSLLAAAAAGFVLSPAAFAATYAVGNLNDSGAGSLRDAIAQANANPGADTITFASNVTGTITLTSGSLVINDDVTIQGPGASVLTIDGNASVPRASKPANYGFYGNDIVINGGGSGGQGRPGATLAASSVTISGLTITGGRATNGGGIAAYNTALTVDNCVVTANYAYDSGGGIYIDGDNASLTVGNSTISNNTADYAGGGMATTSSAITVTQSSVSGNSASAGGGVFIHNDNSNALTVTASTVSGNSASGANYYGYSGGGGVYARHVSATISNSTIANNTSARYGGGVIGHIDTSNTYSTTLANSTVSGNSASYGGGISETSDGAITLTNTAVGGNTATVDADVGTPSGGSIATAFSLIGNTGAATITDNGGNLLNVTPQLGALASNGGPTLTMLPLAGSPLIDAGDPAFSGLATDQRGAGFPRIINGRVDIGAVEFGTAAAAAAVPAPGLGLGGQLGLGALLGLAGLAVARRRRHLGATAGLVLAAALCATSPQSAQAAAGQESRHAEATTITSYVVQDKTVTIVLGNGQTLSARKGQVHTIDKRSSAAHRVVRNPAGIAGGTPAAVRFETGRKGNTRDVRIHLVDTLQQAQALIANKP
ncbi:MAG: hypothetical protein JSS28_06520 [Proteobacteria bacterium]|nr:hypothetical protein [Pseudomonadota bacterium]